MTRYRKWTLNERYFESIDTPEKAYFLGLLYADGYNCAKGNLVKLTLKSSDWDIIERMRTAVETNAPLTVRRGSGHSDSTSTYTTLQLNSKRMCGDLARHGCGQCKGDTIRFPDWLPRELWSHFVRGYFDGDGGLSKEVGKLKRSPGHIVYRCNIVSNPMFINRLNEVLAEVFGKPFYVQKYAGHLKTVQIQIAGARKIEAFLDWIYRDASVYLNRKYALYQEIRNRKNLAVREVYAYDRASRVLVGHFSSYVEAEKVVDVHRTTICKSLKGKTHCKQFIFSVHPIESKAA